MDNYSNKRAVNRVVVSRKGTSHVFKETDNRRDRNIQLCNRLGCSGRANIAKGAQIGYSEKGKSLRPSVHSSSSGKEVIGSSSKTTSRTSKVRKSSSGPHKTLSSQLDTDSSETRTIVQDESEVQKLIPPPDRIQRGLQAKPKNLEPRKVSLVEVGSSSFTSKSRSHRNYQRPGLHSQDRLVNCSISLGFKSTGQMTRAGTSRYGLRNLKCTSISDVIPSSDSHQNGKNVMMKKRNSEGESSSIVRGKQIYGSSSEGWNSSSRNGIYISDSRRPRNIPSHGDNIVSAVRSRRTINSHARASLSNQRSDSSLIPNEHLCGIIPGSPVEVGTTRSFMNRDGFRHYHMDGIAEVLLALERIEHDEELTHEQILVLETNLFLNGLNLYDQHRDMRLDIDNMSYEELLALEERMGTVSTALTEEALSECLKRNIYRRAPSFDVADICITDLDDTKCSICQEDYAVGDEVGSLQCEHRYHTNCIQHWLRLKNWCPICKASAAPSTPTSPS